MFIHLTTHSAYSLGEGLMTPEDLAQAASAQGMPALGLTDHKLLAGSIEFAVACRAAGVQPVLGLEIDLAHGKLALYATSLTGWASLCRLSSALALREDPEAACPLELVDEHAQDLIALRIARRGTVPVPDTETVSLLKDIFADRLYVALQQPEDAAALADLAHKAGLPAVVAHPVYYRTPGQAALQRTLSAIRINRPLKDLPPEAVAPRESHFMSAQGIQARFGGYPAALAATREIAERCKFDLPIGQAHMPTVPLPDGLTAAQFLREKSLDGARRQYGEITPAIQARLDHELEVIAGMGFEPVFLIVEEVLNYARVTGVPFSSRGSAASSLVAHCLGITSPDPLRLNLYFERFLNPARVTPPDIDTDLCSRRRDRVIQHVFDVYGEDRVAMVCTINRYRPRSSLNDTAKAYGLTPEAARELVNRLPYRWWAARMEDEEDQAAQPTSPFDELRAAYPQFRPMFDDAAALLKLPRHLSVHPGGLIVAPGRLTDLVPVMRSGSKGVIITQFDLDSVEALGLIKIDLLGIRGLTVVGDVAQFISDSRPGQYETMLSVLDETPADDEPTAQRVETGGTVGCFQIESPGMRSTLREIRARSEDDIMAALALYRPGPLTGGLKTAFVKRFKGEEQVSHLHPALAPLLDETFGVILYQEQVLRIAHELAGFSLAEADLLRRAMSHFDPGKRMQELQQKFVREAEAVSGIPADTAERVWELMAAFAGYGFPKAHAASYARVAWRSAWCKTHFPAEFMAAVLANWGGYYGQRVYLNEARRMGLSVRPPHINYSSHNFVARNVDPVDGPAKTLFMGLDQVRELTRRTIERILHGAPFVSLEDFLARVDPRPQEAARLASVGALDGFGSIPAILRRLETGGWQKDQMSLFDLSESGAEDWTAEQKRSAQEELLGANLAADALELDPVKVAASGALTALEAAGRTGQRVTVAGVRQSSHHSKTARGEAMLFLTLEDMSGTLEAVAFPDAYRRAKDALNSSAPLLVTGMIELDAQRGEPFLRVEKAARL